jgi:hypothetical protein
MEEVPHQRPLISSDDGRVVGMAGQIQSFTIPMLYLCL